MLFAVSIVRLQPFPPCKRTLFTSQLVLKDRDLLKSNRHAQRNHGKYLKDKKEKQRIYLVSMYYAHIQINKQHALFKGWACALNLNGKRNFFLDRFLPNSITSNKSWSTASMTYYELLNAVWFIIYFLGLQIVLYPQIFTNIQDIDFSKATHIFRD